jgi:hypothetical protein
MPRWMRYSRHFKIVSIIGFLLLLLCLLGFRFSFRDAGNRVFVNYAFATGPREDKIRNLLFYLKKGLTTSVRFQVTFGIVISGDCEDPVCQITEKNYTNVPLIFLRRENAGMDLGAHSEMLNLLDTRGLSYDYYIFLNDGVTGPFLPSYIPRDWHWTEAFTSRMNDDVKLVCTSIVCLPKIDEGGYGPKVESFAFALDRIALSYIRKHGKSFSIHVDKLHSIIDGEYGLSRSVFDGGFTIDTLQLAYQGVDWRNELNHVCNLNRHPSRFQSYYNISMHPLETIFHKSKWSNLPDVSIEYTTNYIEWASRRSPKLISELN